MESSPSAENSAEKGRIVYESNCIACHSKDPSVDGALGPALAMSSEELLKARLLQGGYPKDYKPKRNTGQMPLFPQLRSQIPALHAYLNLSSQGEKK